MLAGAIPLHRALIYLENEWRNALAGLHRHRVGPPRTSHHLIVGGYAHQTGYTVLDSIAGDGRIRRVQRRDGLMTYKVIS